MANEIDITVNMIDKTKSATASLNQGVKSLQGGYTDFKNILGDLQQVLDATIGDYMQQADQIRTLSLATGAGAEETSRLVQVFDDAGVEADMLRMAMLRMKNAGIEPSVSALADMADAYRALSDPTEKVTFLTDNFGARGTELGKVFDQTGQQIRDAGAAVADGLIFDEKKIAETEKLRIAQDTLNDSIAAFKNEIIGGLVPGTNAWIEGLGQVLTAVGELDAGVKDHLGTDTDFISTVQRLGTEAYLLAMAFQGIDTSQVRAAISSKRLMEGYTPLEKAIIAVKIAADKDRAAQEELAKTSNAVIGVMKLEQYGIKATESALKKLPPVYSTVNNSLDLYAQGMIDTLPVNQEFIAGLGDARAAALAQAGAAREMADANRAAFDSINTGLSGMIQGWLDDLAWMKGGGLELQAEFQAINRDFFNNPNDPNIKKRMDDLLVKTELLNIDLGKITLAGAAKEISESLGIPLAEAYAMLKNVKKEMDALNGKEIDVTINVHTNGMPVFPTGSAGAGDNGLDPLAPGETVPGATPDPGRPETPSPGGDMGATSAGAAPAPTTKGGQTIIFNFYGEEAARVAKAEIDSLKAARVNKDMGG